MPPEVRQLCKEVDICPTCCRRVAHQLAKAEAGEAIREVRERVWEMYGGKNRGLMKIAYRREFAEGDFTTIPGFDECCNELQLSYPWIRDCQHLFEILQPNMQDDRPQAKHWDEAIRLLTPEPATAESAAWF